MSKITIDKDRLMEQLRFDIQAYHSFNKHIGNTMELFLEQDGYGSEEHVLASLRWNRHCKELYKSRIVAVLTLIGVFDEEKGHTSDIRLLEQMVNELEADCTDDNRV